MVQDPSPKLAAPGAGLPKPELFIARTRLALRCRRGSRESFLTGFHDEREKIKRLLAHLSPAQRGHRVLIRRVRGLEDSSRHWSVWMTLDHLRITNHAFAGFIASLAKGHIPDLGVDTAALKPDPDVTGEVEALFEANCEALAQSAGKNDDLKTKARHPHPWFGPLDAYHWLALADMHQTLHRVQIQRIIAGL